MIIDLSSLKNNISNKIDIDMNYSFTKEQLEKTEIRKFLWRRKPSGTKTDRRIRRLT